MSDVLAKISWRNQAFMRLIFMTNFAEQGDANGAQTTYLLEGMHRRIPDEIAGEDRRIVPVMFFHH